MWEIENTDEFEEWWNGLDTDEQVDITATVEVLEEKGPKLRRPQVGSINDSVHSNMKELIVQSGGNPIRIFFAFDPSSTGVLLIGGDKTGDKRFYKRMIPIADRLFIEYLEEKKNG